MSTKNTMLISLVLLAAALLAGALLWNRLPDAMASHWGVNDQVNGTLPKFWGVFLLPLMTVGLVGLFLLIPMIDPLKANIAQFRETYNAFIVLLVVFMLYVHGLTLLWNLGDHNFSLSQALLPGLGLIFIFAGVLMRKVKRNFFIGIRTPWTLSSDRVWDETHRVGSILFMVSGGLAVLGALFGGVIAFLLALLPLMATALFLISYSYWLYQQETKA